MKCAWRTCETPLLLRNWRVWKWSNILSFYFYLFTLRCLRVWRRLYKFHFFSLYYLLCSSLSVHLRIWLEILVQSILWTWLYFSNSLVISASLLVAIQDFWALLYVLFFTCEPIKEFLHILCIFAVPVLILLLISAKILFRKVFDSKVL